MKIINMKRLAALFLLSVFILSLFTGCGEATPSEQQQPPPPPPIEAEEEPEYEIFHDYKGVFASGHQKNNPFGCTENTFLADEAMARFNEIAERHGCTLTYEFWGTPEAVATNITTAAATTTRVADMVLTHSYIMRSMAGGGLFVDIESLSDYLNRFDYDKWGNLNVQEMLMVNGKLYGLSPSLWPQKLAGSDYYLVQNMSITNNYAIPDLREAVEKLTWSREMLTEVINVCQDTTLSSPIYGMSAATKHMVRAALLANGCNMLIEDNDALICGWNTPAAVEALTWLQSFIKDNITCFENNNGSSISSYDSGDWGFLGTFCGGSASFHLTSLINTIYSVSYSIDEFAVLPWPTGPYGTKGQWAGYYETCEAITIPIFVDEDIIAAKIIDELYAPLPSAPTKEDILQYYITNVFHDRRDLDVILKQGEYAQYCYWTDGGDEMLNGIAGSFYSKTPKELIDFNYRKMNKTIREAITPNYLAKQEILNSAKG